MKLSIVLLAFFLCCAVAEADIQLFNSDVLGQSTTQVVKLLQDKKGNETEPITTMVDIKNGVYFAATITYPKEVIFQEARESLNRIYKTHENQSLFRGQVMAVWRVEDKKYAISLIKDNNRLASYIFSFNQRKKL